MNRPARLAVALLQVLVAAIAAAAAALPRTGGAAEPKVRALRCGWLLDVRKGTLAEGAVVIVRGGEISEIRRQGGTIPDGAEVHDLSAYTVLPGLIDAHTHTFLMPGDYDVQLLKQSLPRRTLQAAAAARELLWAGFTTIRDLETEGALYGDADLRDAIADGLIPGPRMQVATRAISTTGNYALLEYAPEVAVPKGVQIADGADGMRKAVREQIEHGLFLDETTFKMMLDKGVYYCPTLSAYRASQEEKPTSAWKGVVEGHRDSFRRALRMNVKIASGSDAGSIPHGEAAREVEIMVEYGMPPLRAIQAATVVSAELLGWQDRIGAVEPGRFADLIAVEGNPVADISSLRRVRFVMKGGEVARPLPGTGPPRSGAP